ncbi:MAG: hypothetical protein PHX18_01420 [Candidatus Gastranaerophilales bacterium]|nr:hypothetical protein [Candidatus Gastranaerophilales bacterium]
MEMQYWHPVNGGERYEFSEVDAPEKIKNYFFNKRVPAEYTKKGVANPVLYHDQIYTK